jgi:hypothetical protein
MHRTLLLIAAAHETGSGPSRHFAAILQLGRFPNEADMNRDVKPAESVEIDPKPTSLSAVGKKDSGSVGPFQNEGLTR